LGEFFLDLGVEVGGWWGEECKCEGIGRWV